MTLLPPLLQEQPWNVEAWQKFLDETKSLGNQTLTRESFDLFLKQFPTSVSYWFSVGWTTPTVLLSSSSSLHHDACLCLCLCLC